MHTAADVLRRALSAAGIGALYGRALPGIEVTEVADPTVAVLLAQAHRSVSGMAAAAHVGDGNLVVPGSRLAGGPVPALPGAHLVVADATTLCTLAPVVAEASRGVGLQVQLDVDLSAPAPDGAVERPASAAGWMDADDALGDIPSRGTVVVLAGPGVVQDGAVGGLRALAAAGRLGVLNTWGAKGVFHWQSRAGASRSSRPENPRTQYRSINEPSRKLPPTPWCIKVWESLICKSATSMTP